MKPVRLFVLVLVVLSLAACARTFAYRFADTYIMWQVRGYVSLERSQRSELRDHVNQLLQWHAETEMPHYDRLLRDLEQDILAQSLDADRYAYYQSQIEQRWLAVREAIYEPARELLPQLNDKQVAQLMESLAERIQERADTFTEQGADARREEGAESYSKQIDKWFGEVTDEQSEIIAEWAEAMPDMTDQWIEYRVRWAEGLQTVLAMRNEHAAFAEQLAPLLLSPDTLRPESLQEKAALADQLGQQSVLQIAGSLTESQRQHFAGELRDLRADLASMARTRGVDLATD